MFNHQPIDRIPFWSFGMGFTALHYGLPLSAAYNNPKNLVEAVAHTTEEFDWQDLAYIGYAAMGAWELGGTVKMPESEFTQAPLVTRKPINSEEDVESFRIPDDIANAGLVPMMLETGKLEATRGAPLIMAQIMGPWAVAVNCAGLETICRWVIRKPEIVHKLEQKTLAFSISLLKLWVNTFGAERLLRWVGGSAAAANDVISPKIFKEFFLPYMKMLYDEAHAMGIKNIFCHICGDSNLNLPYWAQLDFGDPGFLTIGQEVDIEIAAKYFPSDVIIGNIEPAIIQTGTPEEVYEVTRVAIEKGKKCPGGFILGPGCELPPKSPEENLWAIMQALSDFGWYE